jgi:hypothetical protein
MKCNLQINPQAPNLVKLGQNLVKMAQNLVNKLQIYFEVMLTKHFEVMNKSTLPNLKNFYPPCIQTSLAIIWFQYNVFIFHCIKLINTHNNVCKVVFLINALVYHQLPLLSNSFHHLTNLRPQFPSSHNFRNPLKNHSHPRSFQSSSKVINLSSLTPRTLPQAYPENNLLLLQFMVIKFFCGVWAIKFLILQFNTLFHNSTHFFGIEGGKNSISKMEKEEKSQLHIDRKWQRNEKIRNSVFIAYDWLLSGRSRFEFAIFGRGAFPCNWSSSSFSIFTPRINQ